MTEPPGYKTQNAVRIITIVIVIASTELQTRTHQVAWVSR